MNLIFKESIAPITESLNRGVTLTELESQNLQQAMNRMGELKGELERTRPQAHIIYAPSSSSAPPSDLNSLFLKLDILKELLVTQFSVAHSSADMRAEHVSAKLVTAQYSIEESLQVAHENISQQQSIAQRSLDEYHAQFDKHIRYLTKGLKETYDIVKASSSIINQTYQLSKQTQRTVSNIEEGLKEDSPPPPPAPQT